ncbi:MAG: hypothetical protein F6K04_04755 [Leptolyngbya sp. SIO4C5]|uniref:hypothetical protein n=1 Tax=Sphaerothrix gracilis TaxID=3151835 RepID=UPI0013C19950|nr:hypothetical protein [Leptolyngbya sp. SIO4C5]
MTLLARLLQLLQFIELFLEFFEFLATPTGLAASAGIFSYVPLLQMNCEAPSAAILASAIALTLYCLLERFDFS